MTDWKQFRSLAALFRSSWGDEPERFKNVVLSDPDEILAKAKEFFITKEHYAYYPSKCYATAVIYVRHLARWYSLDIKDLLNDPELLEGSPFPVPLYDGNEAIYDELLEFSESLGGDWYKGGWAGYTSTYCFLECTQAGLQEVMDDSTDQRPLIDLSINLSYYCNLRCKFCYLGEDRLSDHKKLSVAQLDKLLRHITESYRIRAVDFYGGEIALVGLEYWTQIRKLVKQHSPREMRLITNLTVVNEIVMDPEVDLYVSWDWKARQQSERVERNMRSLERPFGLLMLGLDETLDIGDMNLSIVTGIDNLTSVEVKPYSNSKFNQGFGSIAAATELIRRLRGITDKEIRNITAARSAIAGERDAYSKDHLFVTPDGQLSVLDFDENDCEFFRILEDVTAFIEWQKEERRYVAKNEACKHCRYLGRCLTEHYRKVEPADGNCSGFKNLLIEIHSEVSDERSRRNHG